MRRWLSVPLLLFGACGGGETLSPVSFLWTGRGSGDDYLQAVDVYEDGSAVVTGSLGGDVVLESGADAVAVPDALGSLLLARTNPDGSLAWVRTDGGRAGVVGRGVAALPDGSCIVAGEFIGTATLGAGEALEATFVSAGGRDLFVARYAADGGLLWARQAGGSTVADVQRRITDDDVSDLAAFEDGSCAMVGHFSIRTAFGEGANRVELVGGAGWSTFVARYSADGTLLWARGLTFTSVVHTRVASRADGSCVVVGLMAPSGSGQFAPGTQFPPGTETALRIGDFTVTREADGWTYLAAFDPQGDVLWARGVGRDADAVVWDVAAARDGSFVLVGEMEGQASDVGGAVLTPPLDGRRAFVGRFDALGNAIWARKDDSAGHFCLGAGDGPVVIAGMFLGGAVLGAGEPSETILDAGGQWASYVASLDRAGRLDWARAEGGAGLNLITHPGSLALFRDGRIALAGNFWGPTAIGPVQFTSSGKWDFLLAVYGEDGTLAGTR